MLFNSMQREEPYLGRNVRMKAVKAVDCLRVKRAPVLHGCRQLVS